MEGRSRGGRRPRRSGGPVRGPRRGPATGAVRSSERAAEPQTLEMAVGQLFMVGVLPDATWDESIKDHLANTYAGIFLRRSNLRSIDRARRAIHELRRALGRGLPPLIGIDEEGGFVTNIGHLTTPAPTAAALGAADDADLTQDVYHGIGDKLRAIGVNVVFAPVLDVNSEPANPVIGTRAFGSTPEAVVTHGLAALRDFMPRGSPPA